MATKIRKRTSQRQKIRFRRKTKINARLKGSTERPRLVVYRSNRSVYLQIVDDIKGHTLVSVSSNDPELKIGKSGAVEGARAAGMILAKRALAKDIKSVSFDRGGYLYHGRVQAVADGAREGGLKF